MILMKFWKFESTGNDFVLIDNRYNKLQLRSNDIKALCNRKFGVGADGVILLEEINDPGFFMRYYNSDGNPGSFCGNGGRAISAFAKILGFEKNELLFKASDGLHKAEIIKSTENRWDIKISLKNIVIKKDAVIDSGSPHYVEYVNDIDKIDVFKSGSAIRNSPKYAPHGCNVNFIQKSNGKLLIRTYERGVENETLSCGTGATAAAVFHNSESPDGKYTMDLITKGGGLVVSFVKKGDLFTDVSLQGETKCVFYGYYYL